MPVLFLLLASVVGPSLLFGFAAWESRQNIVSEAERTTRQTVDILREHATKVFEEQQLILEQVDQRIRGMTWDEIGSSEELHRYLAALDKRLEQVGAIWLVDPEGHARTSSNVFPLAARQSSQRNYFTTQRDHEAGVFIDGPIVGSIRGSVQIPVSMRRTTSDGHFDGVIVLAILPDYFKDFYAKTAANDNGVVTLARFDGEILVRYPAVDLPRQLMPESPLMQATQHADQGIYRGLSTVDGKDRIAAFSKLENYRLIVFYGIDFDGVLARWHFTLLNYALFIVPVALTLFLVSWLAFQRTREQQVAQASAVEAQARAEKSDRAKSDFLASMSHEMRTPLNAVIGFAQLIQHTSAGSLSARQLEYIDYILRGGNQMLNLVRDVLDLAKIESGQMRVSIEPVDTSDVIAELASTMAPLAREKGVSLSVESIDGRRSIVSADRARLLQVLTNFVSNAIKYNRPDGSVLITAAPAPDDKAWLRISVADTGRGIPLDRQKLVFQPFNRLGAEHSSIEGTGIGLSICRRLIELMKGRIGFWSQPGEGSRFWIELPEDQSNRTPVTSPAATKVTAEEDHPVCTVLYIEDNPASLALMSSVVDAMANTRIVSAPTGSIGIDLAHVHRPDVIIVDIHLPDIDGYDILQRLKMAPETAAIPVLALLADATPHQVARAAAVGFHKFMTKPYQIADMMAAIEEAYRSSPSRTATNEGGGR